MRSEQYINHIGVRVAKFKLPHVLGDQTIGEDNQELRPGCPPDYQIFCERIDPQISIPTNLSSYLSLTNKNSSMRTSTTYIIREQNEDFGCLPTTNFRIEFCYTGGGSKTLVCVCVVLVISL